MVADISHLTTEQQQITQQLQAIIQQEIKQHSGIIPFSHYMDLALYYPKLGYYMNENNKFGKLGDFVTAPLISNLFGKMLSHQMVEIFNYGTPAAILELGAGTGILAADILLELGDNLSHYYILEISPHLSAKQYATIRRYAPQYLVKVHWLTTLPLVFSGIILANEVLDALPCDLVRFANGTISGVGVTFSNSKLTYALSVLNSSSQMLANKLALPYTDYLTEIHPKSVEFIQSLAATLQQGALLLIDYGYSSAEYYHPTRNQGTLRGFYGQQILSNILIYPGLIDITTSVNWTQIITTALNAGLELIGYTNQANFLLNCGLSQELAQIADQIPTQQYLWLTQQVQQLIAPNAMGEIFKVCGLSKNIAADTWLGFARGDLSYSL